MNPKPTTIDPVAIFQVSLNNGNFYCVFARSAAEAVQVLATAHFATMNNREFRKHYKPVIRRMPDREKLLVNDEDAGQQNWTAKRWSKGKRPGMFCSNTYEN